jgi:DNA-binding MarR family transcriptional regulator
MFLTEKQLVKTLRTNYFSICHWDTQKFSTTVLEEVDLGFGIADLVISKLRTNTSNATERLTYFDAIIYKIIESKKEISFQKLREITKADVTSINRSLNKLIKDSYINKNDSLITFRKTYQGITNDSIAIEAKLKNWKRALDQAFRYKWFAKKSFVVLDSVHIKPAIVHIDQFRKLNVGLAEINQSGKLHLHFNPAKKDPIDYKMWMLLNEVLRKSLFRKKK